MTNRGDKMLRILYRTISYSKISVGEIGCDLLQFDVELDADRKEARIYMIR